MTGVRPFAGITPTIAGDVFIAPGAVVIGDVEIGPGSSIWFNSVVRGDGQTIRIGARTNIQDLSMVHISSGRNATHIGDDVTVGHRAILHGCTVSHHSLIGMGAIILDRAVVGEYAIVGAGALLTEGMQVPPGTLVLGSPAKVRREITDDERTMLQQSAAHYAELARRYRED